MNRVPQCAVCSTPVRTYEVIPLHARHTVLWRARCHGKIDEQEVDTLDYVRSPALAFVEEAKALEEWHSAPADHFVCFSLLITGRHRKNSPTLGALDVKAAAVVAEEKGDPL